MMTIVRFSLAIAVCACASSTVAPQGNRISIVSRNGYEIYVKDGKSTGGAFGSSASDLIKLVDGSDRAVASAKNHRTHGYLEFLASVIAATCGGYSLYRNLDVGTDTITLSAAGCFGAAALGAFFFHDVSQAAKWDAINAYNLDISSTIVSDVEDGKKYINDCARVRDFCGNSEACCDLYRRGNEKRCIWTGKECVNP